MKKTTLLFLATFLISLSVRATHWTVTNSGFTFNPSTISVGANDTIIFSLGGIHNAQEVSQSTWTAGGTTVIAGGFQTPFGGGQVLAASLSAGTHYYVCVNHAGMGMKGQIIVQSSTGIGEVTPSISWNVFPNPAKTDLTIVENGHAPAAVATIDCYSLDGKKIGPLPQVAGKVDVRHLTAGYYVLRIADGDKQTTIQIHIAD